MTTKSAGRAYLMLHKWLPASGQWRRDVSNPGRVLLHENHSFEVLIVPMLHLYQVGTACQLVAALVSAVPGAFDTTKIRLIERDGPHLPACDIIDLQAGFIWCGSIEPFPMSRYPRSGPEDHQNRNHLRLVCVARRSG